MPVHVADPKALSDRPRAFTAAAAAVGAAGASAGLLLYGVSSPFVPVARIAFTLVIAAAASIGAVLVATAASVRYLEANRHYEYPAREMRRVRVLISVAVTFAAVFALAYSSPACAAFGAGAAAATAVWVREYVPATMRPSAA